MVSAAAVPGPRTALRRTRIRLATAIRSRIAGEDFDAAHERIWHAPGPRWFTPDSAIWRVHNDTAMFVGGIRALLLQSLHPAAMQAVSDHSGFRSDPWGRLQRTSHFLASTTFGTVATAEQAIAVVSAVHRRVTGTMPDGGTYRAADPRLLSWVHVAEVDSFLSTHQRYGERRLDPVESDGYVADTAVVAGKLGVPDPPTTTAELAAAIEGFRPELRCTAPALEARDMVLRHPPLPPAARLGYGLLAAGAIATLPMWARGELSLPSLPVSDRLLATPATRIALGTIRWALSGPSSAGLDEPGGAAQRGA